jgi:cell shape-determining protein MreC
METEEEIDQLRQLNEALREKAELLQQENRLLRETIDVGQETSLISW